LKRTEKTLALGSEQRSRKTPSKQRERGRNGGKSRE